MPKPVFSCWPRLMDLHVAAAYLSIGERVLEDWVRENLITPVRMPGGTIKDKSGNVIASAARRRINKILLDRSDLDALIDARKSEYE